MIDDGLLERVCRNAFKNTIKDVKGVDFVFAGCNAKKKCEYKVLNGGMELCWLYYKNQYKNIVSFWEKNKYNKNG
jgi:hypothetical protein